MGALEEAPMQTGKQEGKEGMAEMAVRVINMFFDEPKQT